MGDSVWRTVVAIGLVAAAAGGVSAQSDAPLGTAVSVDPDGCLVEPRAVDEVVALVGTVAPGTEAAPALPATPQPAPAEQGVPADAETTAAVAATLLEVAACTEAGEFARAYALSTDAFIRGTVGPLTEEGVALLAGVGFPNAEERTPPVLTLAAVRLLADGRALAFARVEDPDLDAPQVRGFVLRRDGERWLIDALVDPVPPATPTP